MPIRTIDRALDNVREAFYVARAERKPVVLSVPLDLQKEEFPYLPDYTPSTELMPRHQVLRPDPAVVDEVVAMIAEAERPIVIGGRGAIWSGAKGALEALAEESGALLATTLLGKGLFDGNPFALDIAGTFATDLGREHFAESDLVISAGAGLGHYTTEGGYLFPNAKVVRIDTQPRGLWQGLRTADLHVQADARAAAEAIVTPAEGKRHPSPGLAQQRDGHEDRRDRREPGPQALYADPRHARSAPGHQGARRGDPEGLGHHRRRRPLLQLCDDAPARPARRANITS